MKPRITMNLRDDGEFELWINKEGRDLLVRELLALNEKSDHFHLRPTEFGASEVAVSLRPYRPTDTVISTGKVLFRADDWDRTHFPHVFPEGN
jgi:hypothetical protein